MVRNLNNVYALDSELYRDLESEAIRQYGYEVYYLPKSEQITDELHGEDPLSSFNKSFFMIMDIKTLDAFEGGESFINEIGRGFLKHINLIIETRDFKQYTGDELIMPKPRDLIYVKVMKKFFVIKGEDDEHTLDFFSYGADDMLFNIPCGVMEYSHEEIDTGELEVDTVAPDTSKTGFIQSENDNINDMEIKNEISTNFLDGD